MNTMYGHRDAGFFGYSHFTGGFPGGQAEYVRVCIQYKLSQSTVNSSKPI